MQRAVLREIDMSGTSASTRIGTVTRAATAGLLGLLLAAPPPAAADDDDRRWRGDSVRGERHRGDRDRDDRRREARRHHRDRDERRDRHLWRIDRHRSERARPGPPPRVARDDRRHDHRRHDREARRDHRDHRDWRKHRDRREYRYSWHGHRHEDRKWRPARPARHDDRWHWHDGRWCPPGHRHPPGRRAGWFQPHDDWRWARYRRPPVVHSPYYCAPCSHWYGERYDFDRHVYSYHGLPQQSFQDAVAQLVWGLVYFGR